MALLKATIGELRCFVDGPTDVTLTNGPDAVAIPSDHLVAVARFLLEAHEALRDGRPDSVAALRAEMIERTKPGAQICAKCDRYLGNTHGCDVALACPVCR